MIGATKVTIVLLIYGALCLLIPILIGVYVYRDAKERGMPALLWAIVAALCPAFIGLIVYLLVRVKYSALRCPGCGGPVREAFAVCPRCGAPLKSRCGKCGFVLEPGWSVCPGCGEPIPEDQQRPAPVRKPDRGLKWLVAVLILIPLLVFLFAVISILSFRSVGGHSMMSMDDVSVADLREGSDVARWLEDCDGPGIYALTSAGEEDGEETVIYWIYCSGVETLADNIALKDGSLFEKASIQVNLLADESHGTDGRLLYAQYFGEERGVGLTVSIDGQEEPVQVTRTTEDLGMEDELNLE